MQEQVQDLNTLSDLHQAASIQIWIQDAYAKVFNKEVQGSFHEQEISNSLPNRVEYIELFITHHLLREFPYREAPHLRFELHEHNDSGPKTTFATLEGALRGLIIADTKILIDHELSRIYPPQQTLQPTTATTATTATSASTSNSSCKPQDT